MRKQNTWARLKKQSQPPFWRLFHSGKNQKENNVRNYWVLLANLLFLGISFSSICSPGIYSSFYCALKTFFRCVSARDPQFFCCRIRSWRTARSRVKPKWGEKKKLKICLTSPTQKWCIALISLFWRRWLFKKEKVAGNFRVISANIHIFFKSSFALLAPH